MSNTCRNETPPRDAAAPFLSRQLGGTARGIRVGAALLVATALAACGQITGNSGNSGSDTVTLKLTGGAGPEQQAMESAIAAFEKANPKIKIKGSFAPVDQLQTSLRAQLGAGNAPDLLYVFPGDGSALSMDQLAKAGLLDDLSGRPWAKKIPTTFDSTTQVDGRTMFLPLGQGVIGTVYNKKVFSSLGLKPPTTWTELLATCDTIKKAGKVPLALGAETPWVTQLISYAIAASAVYAQDPGFAAKQRAGQVSFAGSGWQTVMSKYLELQKRGCFNAKPNGTSFEHSLQMVAKGDAAMVVQVNASLAQLKTYNNNAEFGMFALPGVDDPGKVWVPAALGAGYAVSSRSPHKAEARKFLDFLAQPEITAKYLETAGFLPLTGDVKAPVPAEVTPLLDLVHQGRATPYMDQQWPNAEVQPKHFAVIQELLGGKTTVNAALRSMDDAYRQK
jgi:raffinose/stachyose/melibiose transport system substrate-binding protein